MLLTKRTEELFTGQHTWVRLGLVLLLFNFLFAHQQCILKWARGDLAWESEHQIYPEEGRVQLI